MDEIYDYINNYYDEIAYNKPIQNIEGVDEIEFAQPYYAKAMADNREGHRISTRNRYFTVIKHDPVLISQKQADKEANLAIRQQIKSITDPDERRLAWRAHKIRRLEERQNKTLERRIARQKASEERMMQKYLHNLKLAEEIPSKFVKLTIPKRKYTKTKDKPKDDKSPKQPRRPRETDPVKLKERARIARAKYRANHPEKIKEYQRMYTLKKRDSSNIGKRCYYSDEKRLHINANKKRLRNAKLEYYRAKEAEYRLANKDRLAEYRRERYANPKFREQYNRNRKRNRAKPSEVLASPCV